jgi:hypothetical protein
MMVKAGSISLFESIQLDHSIRLLIFQLLKELQSSSPELAIAVSSR